MLSRLHRSGLLRSIMAGLMAVALMLAPFHAHEFVSADGSVVVVAVEGAGDHPGGDTTPAKSDGGCAACWLGKKLQMPIMYSVHAASQLGAATVLHPPREADMAPRSAIFGVFRPPNASIV